MKNAKPEEEKISVGRLLTMDKCILKKSIYKNYKLGTFNEENERERKKLLDKRIIHRGCNMSHYAGVYSYILSIELESER